MNSLCVEDALSFVSSLVVTIVVGVSGMATVGTHQRHDKLFPCSGSATNETFGHPTRNHRGSGIQVRHFWVDRESEHVWRERGRLRPYWGQMWRATEINKC